MNRRQFMFIDKLRDISPDEFRAKVEAAERKVKSRKAIRAFLKQAFAGLVAGLAVGGLLCAFTHYATHGGF
jgi:hypothetical protein